MIRQTIRVHASPRHVPAKIIPVPDIPYTLNMKKVELAIKKTIDDLDRARDARRALNADDQAALQGLYDPDRIRGPLVKEKGAWRQTTHAEALSLLRRKAAAAALAKIGRPAVGALVGAEGRWGGRRLE